MPAPIDISDPFRALSDPTRREIVTFLRSGPLPVRVIAARFRQISRPAVSKHLRILREAAVVSETKNGRERYYELVEGGLDRVEAWLGAVEPPGAGLAPEPRRRSSRTHPAKSARAAKPKRKSRKSTHPVEVPAPTARELRTQPAAPAESDDDWKSW